MSNGNGEKQVEILMEQLAQRSIPDIFEFYSIFRKFHEMAYRRDLWAAAYIINGGCSNDGFMDFRAWLIAQGETIFHDALRDPESLADVIEGEEDEFGRLGYAFLESMNYVAWRAYEKKIGQERPVSVNHDLVLSVRKDRDAVENAKRVFNSPAQKNDETVETKQVRVKASRATVKDT